MAAGASAQLIADRGASAASDRDFFRCRAFLDAEGVTHTLELAGDAWGARVPLIARAIDGTDLIDAISPYGYPGGEVNGAAPPPAAAIDWSATGLVSVFARERILGPPWLASPTERSSVQVHDPQLPRAVRPRLGEQIRANARAGWSVETVPGPDSAEADRDAFALVYAETMRAVGAAPRYLFEREYFDAVLSFERSWLVSARREEAVGASAIAAVSDGALHYYLGGTADVAREQAPFKNVVEAMLDLADELGLPLNLGGGVQPGDGLERFKRGFANRQVAFRTHEVVCDPETYARLSPPSPPAGFFPAYRAA